MVGVVGKAAEIKVNMTDFTKKHVTVHLENYNIHVLSSLDEMSRITSFPNPAHQQEVDNGPGSLWQLILREQESWTAFSPKRENQAHILRSSSKSLRGITCTQTVTEDLVGLHHHCLVLLHRHQSPPHH